MGVYIIPNLTYFLPLSGATVSGGTYFSNSLSATTFYSGSTPLESIILNLIPPSTGLSSTVSSGLNTFTGGTSNFQSVNVSGLTIDNIYSSGSSRFNTLSASTIYSGSTLLETTIRNISISSMGLGSTNSPGLNTFTGGSSNFQSINISGLTIDNVYSSGLSQFNVLSASTIYSGSTDVSKLIGVKLFSGSPESGIVSIFPFTNNRARAYASLSFGHMNSVDSPKSSIIQGYNNKIYSSSYGLNTILNGRSNQIITGAYSTVINGYGNFTNSDFHLTVGKSNIINNSSYGFTFGKYNFNDAPYGFLVGKENVNSGNTSQNKIFGFYNKIYTLQPGESSNSSVIESGIRNTIIDSKYSSINNGIRNLIYNGSYNFLGTGIQNSGTSQFTTVLNGTGNTANGNFMLIGSGILNKNFTASSIFTTILNGSGNTISSKNSGLFIQTSSYASIFGGLHGHVLYNFATIINGKNNYAHGLYSFVCNGYRNYTNSISASHTATTVINGVRNSAKRNYATIVNGFYNRITSNFGFIGNGIFNFVVSEGMYNSILNGSGNTVQGGYNNHIISGYKNKILGTSIRYNSIINGKLHQINNGITGSTIIGGNSITATTSNTMYGDFVNFRSLTGNVTQMVVSSSDGSLLTTSLPVQSISNGINIFTGGTSVQPSLNITSATLSDFIVSGSSLVNSLSATTISGSTIFSGSTNLDSLFLFKSGYLLQKSGQISGSTFSGAPLIANVMFNNPFPNFNYSITITGEDARIWSISSKTTNSFIINSNSNTTINGNVYWIANEIGESYK